MYIINSCKNSGTMLYVMAKSDASAKGKTENKLQELLKIFPHPIRLGIILVVGLVILCIGVVLLVLPGPGIPLIFLGLVILASEFAWAGAVLHRSKKLGKAALDKVRNNGNNSDTSSKSV
jgi:uncharacterized protein (TIGR02611 family)